MSVDKMTDRAPAARTSTAVTGTATANQTTRDFGIEPVKSFIFLACIDAALSVLVFAGFLPAVAWGVTVLAEICLFSLLWILMPERH